MKEASHPENCDWAKADLERIKASINNKQGNKIFMDAKKCKMFVLQNFIKKLLYESKRRRSFWRMFVVANGQITIFQKKFSEKKNDNVQKTANATPSTTLALYMTLIHTM